MNGVKRTIVLDDPRVTLLDLLRERLYLTGTKKGCDRGQCGATVIVDGRRLNPCRGSRSVTTAPTSSPSKAWRGGSLHPAQEASLAHDGRNAASVRPARS